MAAEEMSQLPDDSSLTPAQLAKVKAEAERALREAGVIGVLPTPLDEILTASRVQEIHEDVLNDSFLTKLRKKADKQLKQALSKVLGVFDAVSRLIFVDQLLAPVKKRFISLHEAAHGFLPWQRSMYRIVEDCDKSLDPEAADLFDREANVFASEILFQNDTFHNLAVDKPFEIWTPIRLAKKFDASLYSSIRQYVSKSDRCCVVLVLNPPQLLEHFGFRATLRRVVSSSKFATMFDNSRWPQTYTPDERIGRMVPLGKRRSSGKQELSLTDANGDRHDCIAESFTQKHQVFILIHVTETLGRPKIILPAS